MRQMFFVQPYRLKHTRLVAGGASTFEDQQSALAAGLRAARFRPGVVVLSQQLDARTGYRAKPKVLVIHGRVPASWYDGAADVAAA